MPSRRTIVPGVHERAAISRGHYRVRGGLNPSSAVCHFRGARGSVSINDHTINPDVERFGYKRAGTTTIEIDSSHLVMLSHPKEVADLIRNAIKATESACPQVTPAASGPRTGRRCRR
jgi:hypothetical protein